MKIIISNSATNPIYDQIANQIKNSIARGELHPGEMLPSIRSLAKDLQISVITTKRAYEELEKEGFIETVAGKGSYVTGESSELLREKRVKAIEDDLAKIVKDGRALKLGLEDLKTMLEVLYEEEE